MSVRILLAALAIPCLLVLACAGGKSKTGDGGPRPAGVPASAKLVDSDATFGSPRASEGKDPASAELFFSTSCTDDVLAVVTNRRVVYAELPCDRALPQSVIERFLGKPVRVRLVVASPSKLRFDSSEAGSAEFTVGRMWLAE